MLTLRHLLRRPLTPLWSDLARREHGSVGEVQHPRRPPRIVLDVSHTDVPSDEVALHAAVAHTEPVDPTGNEGLVAESLVRPRFRLAHGSITSLRTARRIASSSRSVCATRSAATHSVFTQAYPNGIACASPGMQAKA